MLGTNEAAATIVAASSFIESKEEKNMAEKKEELKQVTITRATMVHGHGRVERGDVLNVGNQVSKEDAHLLVNIKKAVAGKVKLKAIAPPADDTEKGKGKGEGE